MLKRLINLKISRKLFIVFIVIFAMTVAITVAGVTALIKTRTLYTDVITYTQAELEKGYDDPELDSVPFENMAERVQNVMQQGLSQADELASRMLWLEVGLALFVAVMSVWLVLFAARSISAPITKLNDIAKNVAGGNLDISIDTETKDETGELAESFNRVIRTMNSFVQDLRELDRAFRIDGNTRNRIDLANYSGSYAEVAEAINNLLDYHVASKNEILECITKIVGGQHDAPLRKFPGMESGINEAVDYLRVSVRALEQVIKQKTEAESASEAKSTFLANMSHEIRTPMSAILGITELLMESEEMPENIEQGLITIYNSSNMLLGIINDILDLSKIEAGKLDILPVEYDIASMINDSTQLNVMRIEDRAIDFVLEINEDIPARLIGDELRIKEILNNLLSNAFKYTSEGTITLSVDYILNENNHDITLILRVQDTGFGMTSQQVKELFVEYSRHSQHIDRNIKGTGLGLAITKRLVTLMGGEIYVESERDKGSTFTVHLPQRLVNDEVLGSEVAENLRRFKFNRISDLRKKQAMRDPMPYGKVLIVDDVEPNLYVAEGIMRLYKLQIDTAMSGKEAIEKIKAGNVYDIIFMDHMMPGMDGVETTKIIRETGYTEPVVALTANALAGQIEMMLQNDFDDFISKPINTRRLNTLLNRLIRDKQPPEVIAAAREAAEQEKLSGNGSNDKQELAVLQSVGKMLSDDIYGLDVDSGLEKFGGDPKSYLKTLRAYAKTITAMIDTIRYVDENDLENYRITVHGIKGASYDIFTNSVGKMAETLENAARKNDIDYISISNAKFIYSTMKLIGNIENLLAEVEAQNPKPVKAKPKAERLRELLEACRAFDMKRVEETMADIEKYKYKNDNDLVEWLHEQVSMAKYKQIIERLEMLDL